ncbi:E3 ubiquitin-protein ligase RNF217 [Spinachia spinachia]
MGRGTPGMEGDEPRASACGMPSFARRTETSPAEVAPSVRDSSRRVARTNSRLSLDGGERRREERSGAGVKDARGNNNNNCNGRGERRRASAVEILRRNFGVSKSPSSCLNAARVRRGVEHERRAATNVSNGRGSQRETGEAGGGSEPTPGDLAAARGNEAVERAAATSPRRHRRGGDRDAGTPGEPFDTAEHVYCTVYCIADESRPADDDAVASDAPHTDPETGRDAGSSPRPTAYTLDDLADPLAVVAVRAPAEQPRAEATAQSCRVCLEDKTIAPLPCCRKAVCDECLELYVSSQVRAAKSYIVCPIPECSGSLEEGLVISHLANEDVAKFRYFLELSQLDSSTKPCPQCSRFTSLKGNNPTPSEHKYKIQCDTCQFVWCFKCHAPWHSGVKCRDYRKGDKLLRGWASVIEHGQRNAQKCPRCRIHIQRTEGCDHMTCTQCNTNFCYRCGERYRHLRFFGDHTSNLSVFGCKYRYFPDKPHLRRLIRGSVCGTKVLVAPVVILLVVVLGALALVIGLVVFPVYYVCKRRKKQQRTQGSGRWI